MSHNFLNDSDDFPEYENIEGNPIFCRGRSII